MGASTIRTAKLENGEEIEYDSDMPMGALKGLMSAAREGDLGLIMDSMSQFVTAWPFKGDPSDPTSWEALKRSQFNAVTTAVMEDLGDQGNE